jgi:hypothetical protein
MEILVEKVVAGFGHSTMDSPATKQGRKSMNRNTDHFDWMVFEFSLEELGIDGESSNDAARVALEQERNGYAVLSEQNDEVGGVDR